ncbi:heat shock 70 kDa protein 12A-like [Ruditapes philippinarum]|uniref:heat shock 70 kDa protein 12A-like n=1 Tax=Ruditapes philippinarum TaxID=129788 RepID=UPI00295B8D0E|nr:heat shock 70 kDa protein 12A-like [Ruditapes philippinarum]
MVTIDNENYLRIILLLLEGSTYICKKVFNRELLKNGGDLDHLLKTWKNKLQHEFHKRQMEKFFPNGGFDKTDIHKWDIQMIIGVMLLLFRSTLTDEEKQILKDIKFIRHEVLAHSSSASLCVEKYEDVRKQLEDAIKHLAESFDQNVKIKCNGFIKAFTTGVLDLNSAIHRLQEAKDTDDLFQTVLSVLRETKDSLTKEILDVKQDVRSITKGIEKIEDAECNNFKALTNVQSQIETLQKWLYQNFKDQGSRSSDDFRSLSNQLQEKNKEIGNKIQTYDDSSLQITETRSDKIQHVSFCPEKVSRKGALVVVAGIDFGTTYSGYAFSFKHMYQTNPLNIRCSSFASESWVTQKTTTAVLFEGQKFHSFGFDAELRYAEQCGCGENDNWYFFRHFKTLLYNKKIKRSMKLKTVDGKEMCAITVFAAAIKYLKEDLLKNVQRMVQCINENDIHWVITVPAIWSDPAKQFMREAAYESGIDGEYLSIALESEVASIYCQEIPQEIPFCRVRVEEAEEQKKEHQFAKKPEEEEIQKLVIIASGRKYMVFDLGGGTMDISVHEKQTDGRLMEIFKANGGAVGSLMVNEEFMGVFEKVIGEQLFQQYQRDYPEDYFELATEFEAKKLRMKWPAAEGSKEIVRVPISLAEFCLDHRNKRLADLFEDSIYKNKITFRLYKLRIEGNFIKSFYENYTSLIVKHVSEVLQNNCPKDIGIILMVGGPSQSPIVKQAMVQNFPFAKVIVPTTPSLAVLCGSVLFGHKPQIFSSRISKFSYFLSITPVFDRTIHTEGRRILIDGKYRCRDVFMKFLSCGDTVHIGDARTWQLSSIHKQQDKMVIKVYISDNYNPLYIDEEGTDYLGDIVVDLPDRENEIDHVNVSMLFGYTELIVEATEISKNKTVRAYFDCL